MTRIISLGDHPSNMEKGMRLTNSSVPMSQVGREIYHGSGGFVATMPDGMALEGFYATEAEAREAQAKARGEREVTP